MINSVCFLSVADLKQEISYDVAIFCRGSKVAEFEVLNHPEWQPAVRMLYIFRVDTGCMLNLDTNLALETVAHLKTAVASYCNIPVDKQVTMLPDYLL